MNSTTIPAPKFSIGDTVKGLLSGKIGTVLKVSKDFGGGNTFKKYSLCVQWSDGSKGLAGEHHLSSAD